MKNSTESLDRRFAGWFRELGRAWRVPAMKVPDMLRKGWGEVANRVGYYPEIGEQLHSDRLNMQEISRLLNKCYALGGQFDSIRLGQFLRSGRSTLTIRNLIRDFPRSDDGAVRRIDGFLDRAVLLGFSDADRKPDYSAAALFASLLLTCLQPKRFVEFRRSRWTKMAGSLAYPLPQLDSYGEDIVQAGHFGQEVCATKTFRKHWPDQEPLWALAGICWVGTNGNKPTIAESPTVEIVSDEDQVFPEGRKKEVIHRGHERNRKVVKLAKEMGMQRDRSLPCEICGFSFIDTYGELGEAFIEAHHSKPVSQLKKGQGTKIEDIALVCANCHRMLHRGNKTLSMTELKGLHRRYAE